MIIGKIIFLSKQYDKAYLKILSRIGFLEQYNFTPSEINFKIETNMLICIVENKQTNSISFLQFDPNLHGELLDIDKLRLTSEGISVRENLNCFDFIIDNEIDNKQNHKIIELIALKKLINYNPSYSTDKVNIENLNSLLEVYKIEYSEGGYNKPGDWSRAGISISTLRPANLPNYKLDPYLNQLLPNFEFSLGADEDCIDYKFKDDILRKLRNQIGQNNIEEIKILCQELTTNIKRFAQLIYNEKEHASCIWLRCSKLKTEIKNEYSLIK